MERPISMILFPVFNLMFGLVSLITLVYSAINSVRMVLVGETDPPGMPNWWMYIVAAVSFASLVATMAQMVGSVLLLRIRERGRVLCVNTSLYFLAVALLFSPVSSWIVINQQWDQILRSEPGASGPSQNVFYVSLIAGVVGAIGGSLVYSGLQAFLLSRPRVVAACRGELLSGVTSAEAEARLAQRPMPEFAERSAEAAANPFASPLAAPEPVFDAPLVGSSTPSAIETLIPARNGQALASYYLGLFSLLPLLGFPMGAVAVYLGLRGLARYRQQPEVRGRTHAWVGIVCGSVFGLFNLLLVAGAMIGIVAGVMSGEL